MVDERKEDVDNEAKVLESERYYDKSVGVVFKKFNVDVKKGLSSGEVKKRIEKYGVNELKEGKKINPIMIFINQFRSFIIYILLFAVIISFWVGEIVDTFVILAILIFNAFFGFIQEYKAEKAIESLKKLSGFKAKVFRHGKTIEVDAKELVPGDIVILEEGAKISADMRLVDVKNLEISEASLTGESVPVGKVEETLKGNLGVADRKNMCFSGTSVARGRAKGVVVATGMETEIGKIAGMITEIEKEKTPLQKKLEALGKWIGVITLLISAVVFVTGVVKQGLVSLLLQGNYLDFVVGAREWFLTAVALAVAAVPEGLPAIVTIALALGVRRMLKRNALIRRLPSVETLGATNVICSDKTGTLTKNEMTVKRCFTNLRELDIEGSGYHVKGKIKSVEVGNEFGEKDTLLFKIGVLCNNASLNLVGGSGSRVKIMGDPTEAALVVSGEKAGIKHRVYRKLWKRIDEDPFDSERKMMSTINRDPKSKKDYLFTKGAPEKIIEKCDRILVNGKIIKLRGDVRKKLLSKNEEFAKHALRVLGFAYKKLEGDYMEGKSGGKLEKGLIFVGLQGMIDPPRPEVKESVKKCEEAGIRIVIVTGDNRHTAQAISKDVGIDGVAIDGTEFSELSLQQKCKVIERVSVFARVEPKHKMEIVKLLQKSGGIVAMTGDGVNDAPAIKKADIGIAMGIKGTDVAKETSDMVLLDDNFSSIVNSVEEGRGIYENIRKFVNYLLSSNVAEVLIIFLAILFGMPLPMTAIMLLWINLVTDGLPALSLSVDPSPKNLMLKPPKKAKDRIMNRSMMFNIMYVAILITAGVLGLFVWAQGYYTGLESGDRLIKMQTIAFSAIVIMEFVRLYTIRSEYRLGVFSNKWLVLAVLVSLALQLAVIYTPLNVFFGTVALTFVDWGMILGVAIGVWILNVIGMKVKKRAGWFED